MPLQDLQLSSEAPLLEQSLLSKVLLLLAVGAFCSGISMRVMDPMLPFLASEFQITLREAGNTITYFSIAYGLSLFCIGTIGDRYGKLRVTASACVICALTTFVCAVAPDYLYLRLGRLLSGAANSAIMTLALAWIGDVVPYERRQSVLSRLLIGMSLGVSGGILIGGFAADQVVSWRLVFTILAGCYLLVGSLLFFIQGRVRKSDQAKPFCDTAIPVADDQYRARVEFRPKRLILFTVFAEGALYFGALAFIPYHLHAKYDISLSLTGSIVMLAGLGGLFFAVCARHFVRFGERRLITIGGALMGSSLLAIGLATGWTIALPACFCAGLGFYMLHSTLQTHATQIAPSRRGTAMAAFSSSFFLGQSAGVMMYGLVIEQLSSSAVMISAAIGLITIAYWFQACAALSNSPVRGQ